MWFKSPGGGDWSLVRTACTSGCYCPQPDIYTPVTPYGGDGWIAYTRCRPGGPSPSPSPSPSICTPVVLTSWDVINGGPTKDLSQYQGTQPGLDMGYWRIIEVGYPLLYLQGCVINGVLDGLPADWTPPYHAYTGYMQLQIGCPNLAKTQIDWPGSVVTPTSYYPC